MTTKVFAPSSVTGLFAPAEENEPSRGASFAIEDGVTVALNLASETTVTVDGEPAEFEPVERVLDALGVTASVDVRPEIPLGHGFGASGAATLATALAANAVTDGDRDRQALLQAAHEAELAAGTGQGDVFIQNRGGLLWTAEGEPRRVEADVAVEYVSQSGIDTREMLADETAMSAARRSGTEHLGAIDPPLTMRLLAERSWRYVQETGFATDFVTETVNRVEDAGGAGSMALFGDAVFAVDVTDVLTNRTRVSTTGAHLLED